MAFSENEPTPTPDRGPSPERRAETPESAPRPPDSPEAARTAERGRIDNRLAALAPVVKPPEQLAVLEQTLETGFAAQVADVERKLDITLRPESKALIHANAVDDRLGLENRRADEQDALHLRRDALSSDVERSPADVMALMEGLEQPTAISTNERWRVEDWERMIAKGLVLGSVVSDGGGSFTLKIREQVVPWVMLDRNIGLASASLEALKGPAGTLKNLKTGEPLPANLFTDRSHGALNAYLT